MATTTILLDLDDTLMPEESQVFATQQALCEQVAATHGIDAAAMTNAIRTRCKAEWAACPVAAWCQDIGISAWEGLTGRFTGNSEALQTLHDWAPGYRVRSWAAALADVGLSNESLAEELAEQYIELRSRFYRQFDETSDCLAQLREQYTLAIITNGAPDIQMSKMRGAQLDSGFELTVISGGFGRGKPHASIFEHTLERLGAKAAESVMVGNNPRSDILGANNAGIRAVWMNREAADEPQGVTIDAEIRDLRDLVRMLQSGEL